MSERETTRTNRADQGGAGPTGGATGLSCPLRRLRHNRGVAPERAFPSQGRQDLSNPRMHLPRWDCAGESQRCISLGWEGSTGTNNPSQKWNLLWASAVSSPSWDKVLDQSLDSSTERAPESRVRGCRGARIGYSRCITASIRLCHECTDCGLSAGCRAFPLPRGGRTPSEIPGRNHSTLVLNKSPAPRCNPRKPRREPQESQNQSPPVCWWRWRLQAKNSQRCTSATRRKRRTTTQRNFVFHHQHHRY